jgi:hypothetical protein
MLDTETSHQISTHYSTMHWGPWQDLLAAAVTIKLMLPPQKMTHFPLLPFSDREV